MRSSIRLTARLIVASDGKLDLFVLHDRYRLAPAEILFAARFFCRLGLAKLEEASLIACPGTKDWIVARKAKFYLSSSRPWAMAHRSGADPWEPYLPDLASVDREFFYAKIADPRVTEL